MRRRLLRPAIRARRDHRRASRPARLPETYRLLNTIAGDNLAVTELLAILSRARTVTSVQDEPDGWILLDDFVEMFLHLIVAARQNLDPTDLLDN